LFSEVYFESYIDADIDDDNISHQYACANLDNCDIYFYRGHRHILVAVFFVVLYNMRYSLPFSNAIQMLIMQKIKSPKRIQGSKG